MKLLEKLHLQHPKKEGKALSSESPEITESTTSTTNTTSVMHPTEASTTSAAVPKSSSSAAASHDDCPTTVNDGDPTPSVPPSDVPSNAPPAQITPTSSPSLAKMTKRRRKIVTRLKPSWRQAINRSVSANTQLAFRGREGKLVVGPLRTWKAFMQRGNYEVPQLPASSVLQHTKDNLHYFEANYVMFGLILLAEMGLSCPPLVLVAFGQVCMFVLFDSLVRSSPSSPHSQFLVSHGFKVMGVVGVALLLRYGLWIKLMASFLMWITVIIVHATLRKASFSHHLQNTTPVVKNIRQSVASDVIDWIFSRLPIDLPARPEGGKDVAIVEQTDTVAVPTSSGGVTTEQGKAAAAGVQQQGMLDAPIAAAGG